MATYAVGDIQGCYASFLQLLEATGFNPARDRLWLVGDLINRGPNSLEVLRWMVRHEACVTTVLGNHDLHALAVAEGFVEANRNDTLDPLLTAPDRESLLGWLRRQPLAHAEGDYLMVHAGVLPQWSAQDAVALAGEVEQVLRGEDYRFFLSRMYGNDPDHWLPELRGMGRLRVITNALTRLRVCTPEGRMEFRFKGELKDIPTDVLPWFDVPARRSADVTVIFGHWSALGLQLRDNLVALDTGCLWGGRLSAMRLEDRQLFQVSCVPQDQVKKLWHA